jgi:hypothetical protein
LYIDVGTEVIPMENLAHPLREKENLRVLLVALAKAMPNLISIETVMATP